MLQGRQKTGTKWDDIIEPIDQYRYKISKSYKNEMLVDAIIYADADLLPPILNDLSPEQVCNVASLPGIIERAMAMPDVHQGYGFPIGGVAAMDVHTGVVSPGGVGFDINCGVRLLTANLSINDVRPKLKNLVEALFSTVPSGAGSGGKIKLHDKDINDILENGLQWALERGYATEDDVERTEERGEMPGADPAAVSPRAKKRGSDQLGTLGSGNHFLEIDRVEQIFDRELADAFGLFEGQICFMTHCGSRGLGHQVCTDYVSTMKFVMQKYSIELPDRELACCPISSPEGRQYLSAMAAAANFAFVNRQCIAHYIRQTVKKLFPGTELNLLYDVAHNMAKFENHFVQNQVKQVLVHRKGATRAFPAGREELPEVYSRTGQPVIIPGDMGRASYILVGTELALQETFGSVCHGAGRVMSRTAARKGKQSKDVIEELLSKGVIARATTREGLTEEVPEAYKSIDQVVGVVHNAGLARKVARIKPVGVVKG
ncbi:MAG: RtcB family protein [Candidatus Obscuribacterales bacterium]|nr:RtcB family protein [Candidatus Obscuribacterales bacterium]